MTMCSDMAGFCVTIQTRHDRRRKSRKCAILDVEDYAGQGKRNRPVFQLWGTIINLFRPCGYCCGHRLWTSSDSEYSFRLIVPNTVGGKFISARPSHGAAKKN